MHSEAQGDCVQRWLPTSLCVLRSSHRCQLQVCGYGCPFSVLGLFMPFSSQEQSVCSSAGSSGDCRQMPLCRDLSSCSRGRGSSSGQDGPSVHPSLPMLLSAQYLRSEGCFGCHQQLWGLDRLWLLRLVSLLCGRRKMSTLKLT